jgi:hypothetical protein
MVPFRAEVLRVVSHPTEIIREPRLCVGSRRGAGSTSLSLS